MDSNWSYFGANRTEHEPEVTAASAEGFDEMCNCNGVRVRTWFTLGTDVAVTFFVDFNDKLDCSHQSKPDDIFTLLEMHSGRRRRRRKRRRRRRWRRRTSLWLAAWLLLRVILVCGFSGNFPELCHWVGCNKNPGSISENPEPVERIVHPIKAR